MTRVRPNITTGTRNKEVYSTRGGDNLGFIQRESDRLAPSGRFTQQGDTIYSPYPRSEAIAMRKVFHPSTGNKSGEAYVSPLGTTTSMRVEPEWYAQRGYDFSDDPGIFNYPMIGESTDLYFNEGGIAGLPGQWSPSTITGEEETFDIKTLGLDPGIMSIDDLEALFEEVGLDKRIIHDLINTGGLSQLVS